MDNNNLIIGEIVWFDTMGKDGVLVDADGNQYEFTSDSFINLEKIVKNQIVMFEPVVCQDLYVADNIQRR